MAEQESKKKDDFKKKTIGQPLKFEVTNSKGTVVRNYAVSKVEFTFKGRDGNDQTSTSLELVKQKVDQRGMGRGDAQSIFLNVEDIEKICNALKQKAEE